MYAFNIELPDVNRLFWGLEKGMEYSCLENSMDREAWQATVHGLSKSRTPLDELLTAT